MPFDPSTYLMAPGTWSFGATPGTGIDVGATIAAGMTPYAGLATGVNQLMTQQARAPFEANLPDYTNLVTQRSANTGSLLRGEVPQDVQNQIIQAGAERGIATGSPGSPNANAAWLRALGLTSLGLQQQGSAQLSQSIKDTPFPELFSPASLFVPERLAQLELEAARAGLRTPAAATAPSNIPWGQSGRQWGASPMNAVGHWFPSASLGGWV